MTINAFKEIFRSAPEATADAPGRVNILGDHTDYNDGFVLSIATPQRMYVQMGHSTDDKNHFYSAQKEQMISCTHKQASPVGFASYITCCLHLLQERGLRVPPICIYIDSKIPIRAGLSGSAAMEVAVLRGIKSLLGIAIDDVEIGLIANQAEVRFVRPQCGLMNQMACSLADSNQMLFLDVRTHEHRLLPLPDGAQLLVIDSGVPYSVEDSSYIQRRAECKRAAHLLGVRALRDVTEERLTATLPPPLNLRALHVVTEIGRVLEASRSVSAMRLGELMNGSHLSLKNNLQVSIRPLDLLVELLQNQPEVYGARMTGAGFGGTCIALVKQGSTNRVAAEVMSRYRQHGYEGKVLIA